MISYTHDMIWSGYQINIITNFYATNRILSGCIDMNCLIYLLSYLSRILHTNLTLFTRQLVVYKWCFNDNDVILISDKFESF